MKPSPTYTLQNTASYKYVLYSLYPFTARGQFYLWWVIKTPETRENGNSAEFPRARTNLHTQLQTVTVSFRGCTHLQPCCSSRHKRTCRSSECFYTRGLSGRPCQNRGWILMTTFKLSHVFRSPFIHLCFSTASWSIFIWESWQC